MDTTLPLITRLTDTLLPLPPGETRGEPAEGDAETPNMRVFVYGNTVTWVNEPPRVECDCRECT